MFGFFRKKDNNSIGQDFVYDQGLLVRIPLDTEFGNDLDRKKMIGFKEELKSIYAIAGIVLIPAAIFNW